MKLSEYEHKRMREEIFHRLANQKIVYPRVKLNAENHRENTAQVASAETTNETTSKEDKNMEDLITRLLAKGTTRILLRGQSPVQFNPNSKGEMNVKVEEWKHEDGKYLHFYIADELVSFYRKEDIVGALNINDVNKD